VPVRLEIGPRDVAQGSVMTVRRDNRAKEAVPLGALRERLGVMLEDIQRSLFRQAAEFRAQNTAPARTLAEVEAHFAARRGFAVVPWEGDARLEAAIKERTGATLRCIPLEDAAYREMLPGASRVALFARAY